MSHSVPPQASFDAEESTGDREAAIQTLLHKRSGQLRNLAKAALAVTRATNLDETLREITHAARRIIGAHQGVVSLPGGTDWSQAINTVALTENYSAWQDYAELPDGSGIYAWVCEENTAVRFTQAELEAHPRWRAFSARSPHRPSMRGWLAAPLIGRDGSNLGLIQLSDKEDGSDFDAADEAMLVQLAQLASAAVEQSQMEAALRESEKRLRLLNENLESAIAQRTAERDRIWQLSPDLMCVATTDGTLLSVNPAWQRLLGWPANWLEGRAASEIKHPDDEQRTASELARLAGGGYRTVNFEDRYRHQDGSWRWFSWVVEPENDLLYCIGRDVTAEKDALAELERTHEALRQSQKMEAIGQLTGGIAHDFNNLLAAVVGNLDLLGRKLQDERLRRYVDSAMAGAQRGAQLTSQLLAFARRQRLSPKVVDVNTLVKGTIDNLLRRTLGGLITIEMLPDEELWPAAVDPTQLESALLNLGLNARDAIPNSGSITVETSNVRVRPGTHADLAPGDYVLVAVTDTGLGMPPEVVAKATEPFYTTKGVGKGTGLGLSTVYGFLRQSGGTLRITSHPGAGTTVQLYLPKSEVPAQPAQERSEVRGRPSGEIVMVVDDDPDVCATTSELLVELGYAVVTASGGARALEVLASNSEIRTIVTDYAMPGMSGADFLQRARKIRPDLKAVVATGYAEGDELGQALPSAAVLRKPFSLTELAEGLRHAG